MKPLVLTFAVGLLTTVTAHAAVSANSCEALFSSDAVSKITPPSRTQTILPYVGQPAERVDLYSIWKRLNHPATQTGLQGYAGRALDTGKSYFVFKAGPSLYVFTENGPRLVNAKTPVMILDNGAYLHNQMIIDLNLRKDPRFAIDKNRILVNGQIVDLKPLDKEVAASQKPKSQAAIRAGLESQIVSKIGEAPAKLLLAKFGDVLNELDSKSRTSLEELVDTLSIATDQKTGEKVALMFTESEGHVDKFYAFISDGTLITSTDLSSLRAGKQTFLLSGERKLIVTVGFIEMTTSETTSYVQQPSKFGRALGERSRTLTGSPHTISTGRAYIQVDMQIVDPVAERNAARLAREEEKRKLDRYGKSVAGVAKVVGVPATMFAKLVEKKAFSNITRTYYEPLTIEALKDGKIGVVKLTGPAPADVMALQFTDVYDRKNTIVVDQSGAVIASSLGDVSQIAVSPAKDDVAFVTPSGVMIYTITHNHQYTTLLDRRGKDGSLNVSYSPSGKHLLVSTNAGATVYTTASYAKVATFNGGLLFKKTFTDISWLSDNVVGSTDSTGERREYPVKK
jgi:hypothetical protein